MNKMKWNKKDSKKQQFGTIAKYLIVTKKLKTISVIIYIESKCDTEMIFDNFRYFISHK